MINASEAEIDDVRENLLEQYLSLPDDQREQKFPTTERAAKLTGMSRRTIQYWVEIRDIKAVFVGKICRVELDSLMTYLKRRVNGRKGCDSFGRTESEGPGKRRGARK
ncbi:MAG: helix-turn-helix domain-containing protein [Blastocatellia bacterium]